jgi:hypothetical protein
VARQLYAEHFHALPGLSDKAKDVESFGLIPMTVILNDGHGCDDQAKLDVGSEADRRARVLKRLK